MEPALIKATSDIVVAFLKRRTKPASHVEQTVKISVDRHLRAALNWSSRVQFYGMAQAEETESVTIALRLHREPRRFRHASGGGLLKSEDDLIADRTNYLLLGDPGAGKTTTIKRLVRTLLLHEPVADTDTYQIPIVLRLRELEPHSTLAQKIATELGIPFETRQDATSNRAAVDLWVGDMRLEHAIIDFLSSSHAVLLLDGLDEVPLARQEDVQRQISALALHSDDFKIIVTCRSGDYTRLLEGFDVLELCPLEREDIIAIATAWLSKTDAFLEELEHVPYQDIVDRPLLLTQLLYIFKRYGYLPEQPHQVYRKVIALLLHEWDAERGITRASKYAGFDPERKIEFLSALAYYLTYRVKKKTFTEEDLSSTYATIHDRFNLPLHETSQVVSEVQTHTGIIAAAGASTFEFAHLSIQEYLCADYLIREPLAEHLADYLREYPAPVAIAVALSSNASAAFASLFLKTYAVGADGVQSFLSRLMLERPSFGADAALGISILKLYQEVAPGTPAIKTLLDRLVERPSVGPSVLLALEYYEVSANYNTPYISFIRLNRTSKLVDPRGFSTPSYVYMPVSLLTTLARGGFVRAAKLHAAYKRYHLHDA